MLALSTGSWIIDIKGFFDSIDHELLLRAVRKHTTCPWVLLYIERWLKAPVMMEDGTSCAAGAGDAARRGDQPAPGQPVSALRVRCLAEADDFLAVPFERYADDIVCHCRSEREALALRQVLDRRFSRVRVGAPSGEDQAGLLQGHQSQGDHAIIQFDFLGYTFRPRLAKWRGGLFGVSFLPAASPKALKAIRQAIRGWSLQTRSDKALDDLARMFNPYIRGWINYYSHFYKSALYPTLRRIDVFLLRWARRKFKRLRQQPKGARAWLARVVRTSPDLFAHWPLLYGQGRTLGAV